MAARKLATACLLRSAGLLSDEDSNDAERISTALHAALAASPARLIAASLYDVLGETRQPNLPGTVDEYPNWRVPLGGPDGEPVLVEDLPNNLRLRRLIGALTI